MTTDSNSNSAIPKITRDDEEAGSGDLARENIARLKALFPQIVADGKVDFDVLRQLLGDEVEEGEERYGLNWKGKRRARAFAMTPSLGTLRPAPEDSVDWDTTQNIMIEGDNLEVLKLLRRSYVGKVKLIYIDPPYNTGKEFVYPDNYKNPLGEFLKMTGQVGSDGEQLSSNSETSGRYHADWLSMMYPRLIVAKEILSDDGFIVASIDQNEVNNLKALMDTVFGEENLVSIIDVIANPRGRQSDSFVATIHEHLVVYAKNISKAEIGGVPLTAEQTKDFSFDDEDGLGPYRLLGLRQRGAASLRTDRPEMFYPVYVNPDTDEPSLERTSEKQIEVLPLKSDGIEGRWMWGKKKFVEDHNRLVSKIVQGRGEYDIFVKDYLIRDGQDRSRKFKSIWTEKGFNNQVGTVECKELMEADIFQNPKPVFTLKHIQMIASSREITVMDFFAGSGTTGHAVFEQNASDGGNRRFILVQLPEPLSEENKQQKRAAEYCADLGKPHNIAELTKERLRRAGEKVREENPDANVDTGFRVYKLAASNLKAWQPDPDNLEASILDAVDNVLPDRSEEDLLVELLLKTGIDLTMPEEEREIAGQTVHALGGGALMVCLGNIADEQAEELGQGMADWVDELDPAQTTVYFKDSGIGSDGNRAATKANLAAILRQRLGDRIAKIASI